MNSNDQMITCVTVNDPTKLTNYHVNRIQVNCCSSSNDTNGSISPTSTSSTISSKLFCLDKKIDQNKFSNYCSNLNQIKDNKLDSKKNKSQKNLTDTEDDLSCKGKVQNDLKKNIKKDSKKSIYTEQSLQKQIHQFKERQQNQLRTYSSTSSSSSNSSRKFLNKNESEPLNSFNYSLNSNCSTTDTLITNSTLNNKAHTLKGSSDSQKNDSVITENIKISIQPQLNENSMNKKDQTTKNDEKQINSNEVYLFSLKRPKEFVHYTHEIKFMKTPGCTFFTSFIIFITILVISLLFTICVYISVQAFDAQSLNERTFEGQMVSLNLSHFYLANKISNYNQLNELLVKDFKNKFERLFNKTNLISKLKRVEIVNIKNNETNLKIEEELNQNKTSSQEFIIKNDTVLKSFTNMIDGKKVDASVFEMKNKNYLEKKIANNSYKNLLEQNHLITFKFHFISNELDYNLSASNLYLLISSELIKLNESLFYNYQLDQNSLHIKEIFSEDNLDKAIQSLLSLIISNNSLITNSRRLKRLRFLKSVKLNQTFDEPFDDDALINKTLTNKPKYVCEEKKLKFCNFLPYKQVLYPNLVNHLDLIELEKEFFYFRQIIDSECFHFAKEYICLLLQPACPSIKENSILPCTGLCENFLNSCSNWIPNQIRKRFTTCQQINDMKNQFLTEFIFLNKTRNKEVLILNNLSKNNSNEVIKKDIFNLFKNNETKNDEIIYNKLIENSLKINLNYTVLKNNDKNNLNYLNNESSLYKTNLTSESIKLNEHLNNNQNIQLNSKTQDFNYLENNLFKNLATNNSLLKSNNQQLNNNNCFNLRNLQQLNSVI